MPHALIAAFGGDTVEAARSFADRYAPDMNVTVLVDFDNDSIGTALAVADALGGRLWGVRLDTSERLVDRALEDLPDADEHRGVSALLVRRVPLPPRSGGEGSGVGGEAFSIASDMTLKTPSMFCITS